MVPKSSKLVPDSIAFPYYVAQGCWSVPTWEIVHPGPIAFVGDLRIKTESYQAS